MLYWLSYVLSIPGALVVPFVQCVCNAIWIGTYNYGGLMESDTIITLEKVSFAYAQPERLSITCDRQWYNTRGLLEEITRLPVYV